MLIGYVGTGWDFFHLDDTNKSRTELKQPLRHYSLKQGNNIVER